MTYKFESLHLNFSSTFTLQLKVMDIPPPPPPPETLGERVRFQIVKISKKGAVTVKVKPKVTNTMLTRKLNNESISFYLQPYDRAEF